MSDCMSGAPPACSRVVEYGGGASTAVSGEREGRHARPPPFPPAPACMPGACVFTPSTPHSWRTQVLVQTRPFCQRCRCCLLTTGPRHLPSRLE